jgi:hydrocephalus-inducing protein
MFQTTPREIYDIVLLLDMDSIGNDMLTLPITAICEIPEIIIEPHDIVNFGNVYIYTEKTETIKLINTSKTLAQFEVVPP